MKRRIRQGLLAALILAAVSLVAFVGPVLRALLSGPEHLSVAWEGPFIDHNFRDIGASMNECLGERRFAEGAAFRAAGWFSGWDCRSVGSPDVIYSLNYDPKDGRRFFCRAGDEIVVGESFNKTKKLSDLELLPTWDDPAVAENVCGFFAASFGALGEGQKILVHCDAGRDRTGTYAALLSALVAEERGFLDDRLLDAVECDYRRSRSLKPYKYGRMRTFLTALEARGGVARFLTDECHLDPKLLSAVAARMAPPR